MNKSPCGERSYKQATRREFSYKLITLMSFLSVIVEKNGGSMLLCLASIFLTLVGLAGRQTKNWGLEIHSISCSLCFLFLMLGLM